MIIKLLPLLIISVLLSVEANTQEKIKSDCCTHSIVKPDTDPDYFYSDDVLIDGVVYWLACKKTVKKGVDRFQFDLHKGAKYESFEMTHLYPSNKTDTIFQTGFKNAYHRLLQTKTHANLKDSAETEKQIKKAISGYLSVVSANMLEKQKVDRDYFYHEAININDATYLLGCKKTDGIETEKFHFDLCKKDICRSFKMNDIKPSDSVNSFFKIELQKAFKDLNENEVVSAKEGTIQLNIDASRYLFDVYTQSNVTIDSSLVVGELKVKQSIKCYDKSDKFQGNIEIQDVQIKFELEQIVDIKVTAIDKTKNPGQEILFQNRIPISYSTKDDVSGYKRNTKKCKRCTEKSKKQSTKKCKRCTQDSKLYDNRDSIYVKMGDVFTNDYRLLSDTENYSPKDQVVHLKPNRKKLIMKDDVNNLLTAEVYSDLLGLSGSHPNGLIQTEVSKRVYLNRRTHQLNSTSCYYGYFNSVRPKITISKLEENNKYLQLENGPDLFVNTLDIFRYSSWRTGGEVNVFFMGVPSIHSIFYVNVGGYVLHTPVRLPVLEEGQSFNTFRDIKINNADSSFKLNTVALFPEIYWIVSPHSNFRLSYNAKCYRLLYLPRDITVINDNRSSVEDNNNKGSRWIVRSRIIASLKVNNRTDGRIFFRSYFNFSFRNFRNNYLQTQIGYSFNILDKRKSLPSNK